MFRFVLLFIAISFLSLHAKDVKIGVLHKSIECLDAKEQSYALYLPSSYKKDGKKFPVVFGFSPAARGSDPVQLCQAAAEKFGFVLIGSNNSKNGSGAIIDEAFAAMTSDAFKRYNIDEKQVYYVGFSGGSRVSLRKVLEKKYEVKGVIACGAFLSPDGKIDDKDLVLMGFAGKDDFNYTEYLRGYEVLKGTTTKYWFHSFDGGHQWPTAKLAYEAIELFSLEARRKAGEDVSALEKGLIAKKLLEVKDYMANKDYIHAFNLLRSLQDYFKNNKEVEDAYKKNLALAEVKAALDAEKAFFEDAMQLKNLGDNDKYWALLNDSLKKANTEGAYQKQYHAVLSSLYSGLRNAISRFGSNTSLKDATKGLYCLIAFKINPKDHDVGWFGAALYASAKNTNRSLDILEFLFANGYTDKARIENEKAFDSLRKEERYLKLMKK